MENRALFDLLSESLLLWFIKLLGKEIQIHIHFSPFSSTHSSYVAHLLSV